MIYYLNIEEQIQRIAKIANLFDKRRNNDSKSTDITDGRVYKKVKQALGRLIDDKEAFTFLINTDGVKMAESSTLSMWPVFLAINEISIKKRFCIDNVIVAGNLDFCEFNLLFTVFHQSYKGCVLDLVNLI